MYAWHVDTLPTAVDRELLLTKPSAADPVVAVALAADTLFMARKTGVIECLSLPSLDPLGTMHRQDAMPPRGSPMMRAKRLAETPPRRENGGRPPLPPTSAETPTVRGSTHTHATLIPPGPEGVAGGEGSVGEASRCSTRGEVDISGVVASLSVSSDLGCVSVVLEDGTLLAYRRDVQEMVHHKDAVQSIMRSMETSPGTGKGSPGVYKGMDDADVDDTLDMADYRWDSRFDDVPPCVGVMWSRDDPAMCVIEHTHSSRVGLLGPSTLHLDPPSEGYVPVGVYGLTATCIRCDDASRDPLAPRQDHLLEAYPALVSEIAEYLDQAPDTLSEEQGFLVGTVPGQDSDTDKDKGREGNGRRTANSSVIGTDGDGSLSDHLANAMLRAQELNNKHLWQLVANKALKAGQHRHAREAFRRAGDFSGYSFCVFLTRQVKDQDVREAELRAHLGDIGQAEATLIKAGKNNARLRMLERFGNWRAILAHKDASERAFTWANQEAGAYFSRHGKHTPALRHYTATGDIYSIGCTLISLSEWDQLSTLIEDTEPQGREGQRAMVQLGDKLCLHGVSSLAVRAYEKGGETQRAVSYAVANHCYSLLGPLLRRHPQTAALLRPGLLARAEEQVSAVSVVSGVDTHPSVLEGITLMHALGAHDRICTTAYRSAIRCGSSLSTLTPLALGLGDASPPSPSPRRSPSPPPLPRVPGSQPPTPRNNKSRRGKSKGKEKDKGSNPRAMARSTSVPTPELYIETGDSDSISPTPTPPISPSDRVVSCFERCHQLLVLAYTHALQRRVDTEEGDALSAAMQEGEVDRGYVPTDTVFRALFRVTLVAQALRCIESGDYDSALQLSCSVVFPFGLAHEPEGDILDYDHESDTPISGKASHMPSTRDMDHALARLVLPVVATSALSVNNMHIASDALTLLEYHPAFTEEEQKQFQRLGYQLFSRATVPPYVSSDRDSFQCPKCDSPIPAVGHVCKECLSAVPLCALSGHPILKDQSFLQCTRCRCCVLETGRLVSRQSDRIASRQSDRDEGVIASDAPTPLSAPTPLCPVCHGVGTFLSGDYSALDGSAYGWEPL
ncbi:hypothetical protein KIPB_002157 [Kipferlia bialata]|uniref:Uncharacterized protein n=1 Tax=Kipferlia bialata TaxID=797122 RepID=A0A9K3CRD1_9EUKA|nr:hypothetical protein KIPB_002157 [Kipferlia bialata]|eukprot:g2157.t1